MITIAFAATLGLIIGMAIVAIWILFLLQQEIDRLQNLHIKVMIEDEGENK